MQLCIFICSDHFIDHSCSAHYNFGGLGVMERSRSRTLPRRGQSQVKRDLVTIDLDAACPIVPMRSQVNIDQDNIDQVYFDQVSIDVAFVQNLIDTSRSLFTRSRSLFTEATAAQLLAEQAETEAETCLAEAQRMVAVMEAQVTARRMVAVVETQNLAVRFEEACGVQPLP